MDRRVPSTGNEDIELYIRTYYSLLRSSEEVQIKTLVEAHARVDSSLHGRAREPGLDVSALVYCTLRLPACIDGVRLVVLGQSQEVFARRGYPDVENWQPVSAAARRRRAYYDGAETLACYIASRSDIDDIVPMLAAYQIEWNKLHGLLQSAGVCALLERLVASGKPAEDDALGALAAAVMTEAAELRRLQAVWGGAFAARLLAAARAPRRFAVRLLAGSLVDYRRATSRWWLNLTSGLPYDLTRRPVYFVSSNMHSLVNLLSGFALRREPELVRYIESAGQDDLLAEYRDIRAHSVASSRENFLYYVLKKYVRAPEGAETACERIGAEQACGIRRAYSAHSFEVDAQFVELCQLRPDWLDPRLHMPGLERLAASEAVLLNIDYPLGMAAQIILGEIAETTAELRGVYILGKAATLNGTVGDAMLPNVVHDEQSQNTYLFQNCLQAGHVASHLVYGTALDNQKAVSVRGTFLQNSRYMDVFYREGYTDIEMEAGPFLSAVYEAFRPIRYPMNEIVNLHGLPFDLGIVHYASDTPLSKAQNLGAGNLSYFGMDPTYAGSIAILRRIFALEVQRCAGGPHANS